MICSQGSITIERGIAILKHRWKNENKVSIYKKNNIRAFLRISGCSLVNKIKNLDRNERRVEIVFEKKNNNWSLLLKRNKNGKVLQIYTGKHSYLQLVLNKDLPEEFWLFFEKALKKTMTKVVTIGISLKEWNDVDLRPEDFLPLVEKHAKDLLIVALNNKFKVDYVSKGKSYDLNLIGPKGQRFLLGISSHNAKSPSRSKEHRLRKILLDISKMLPELEEINAIPVMVVQSIKFDGSWSYTTDKYLDFYKKKFGFQILITDFCKNWEENICSQLEGMENSKLFKVKEKNFFSNGRV